MHKHVVGNSTKLIDYHFLKNIHLKLLWCKFIFIKNIWLSHYQ